MRNNALTMFRSAGAETENAAAALNAMGDRGLARTYWCLDMAADELRRAAAPINLRGLG